MPTKIALKNGLIFTDGQFKKLNILIANQKIIAIQDPSIIISQEYHIIDVADKYVFPGFIDLHVHLREPGLEHKETIATGTKAAAAGGYTQVFAMPNTAPVIDTPELVAKFNTIAKAEATIKTKTYAAITHNLKSDQLVDFEKLAKLGVIGFSNDGVGVQTGRVMYEAMTRISKLNMPLAAHCEDSSLMYDGSFNQGVKAKKLGINGILGICESSQIARDIMLAEATNCHYHVCHVSKKESLRIISDAKKAGINITVEVSPHHLLLNDENIPDTNYQNYKMNPPLRNKADQQALLEALIDGTIDCIATDHAPHTIEDKDPSKPIKDIAFGIIGLEHAFPLLYTEFVKTGILSLARLVELFTSKPAEIYNLLGGIIKENTPADLTVYDLNQEFEIQPPFISKGVNTPFIGRKITGKTKLTMVDGNIVYCDM